MAILTGNDAASAAPAPAQDEGSAALIANGLLEDRPTVRALPSKSATHQRPSLGVVNRIHARARKKRASERGSARTSTGWTFLEWQAQTTGVGSFWKVSYQHSGGCGFYLFEHYSCARTCVYEGPSYVYVVLNGRLTYLGFLFGGQLITA
jgi:hypothetical protein